MIGTKIGMVSRQMAIQSMRQPSTTQIAIMMKMIDDRRQPSPFISAAPWRRRP